MEGLPLAGGVDKDSKPELEPRNKAVPSENYLIEPEIRKRLRGKKE